MPLRIVQPTNSTTGTTRAADLIEVVTEAEAVAEDVALEVGPADGNPRPELARQDELVRQPAPEQQARLQADVVVAQPALGVAGRRVRLELERQHQVVRGDERPLEAGVHVGEAGGVVVDLRVEEAVGQLDEAGQAVGHGVLEVARKVLVIGALLQLRRAGRPRVGAEDAEAAALTVEELRAARAGDCQYAASRALEIAETAIPYSGEPV
jgi:hypothetical protein